MNSFIEFLNNLPPVYLWLGQFLLCYSSILIALYFWGKQGLYVYLAVAIIASNIQVLKIVEFKIFPDPIALGTTLFTSTFLCTDILYELYGKKAATQGIHLGFFAFLLFTLVMILTLGFTPLSVQETSLLWAQDTQEHLKAIFLPTPSLFIAGMSAYLVSQYTDIFIYGFFYKLTSQKHLWLRNTIATIVSCFLDSFLFSFLAFYVLGNHAISLEILFKTYVLGSFLLRCFIGLLDTPFLYLALHLKPKE